MSNALAIAAVTETLVSLIGDSLAASGVGAPSVTALAPDGSGTLPNPGVNVYLYQVTPNTAYRNADLPTRGPDGALLRRPQVALDLHYLLTFYGDDGELEPQRLLGATALALHAKPTLPRSLIQTVQSDPGNLYLSTSTLHEQAELVRFSPIVFSLEELSKLWSFLLKIDYVLSTAYVASVVLIETDDPVPPPPLPVLGFTAQASAIATPVITAIVASPNPAAPITDGATITLQGVNLGGATTQVLVTGTTLTPAGPPTPTSITVTLTPGAFSAGPQTAQVVQPVVLGKPPAAHPGTGVVSSIATFVLAPTVGPGSPASAPGPVLHVPVVPQAQPGQRAVLLLTPRTPPGPQRLVDGGVLAAAAGSLTFPMAGVAHGTYLVQVLVDGAMSPLTPFTGAPTGPLVTI